MQIEPSTEHVQFASPSELKAFNQRMISRYHWQSNAITTIQLWIAQVCDKRTRKQVSDRVSKQVSKQTTEFILRSQEAQAGPIEQFKALREVLFFHLWVTPHRQKVSTWIQEVVAWVRICSKSQEGANLTLVILSVSFFLPLYLSFFLSWKKFIDTLDELKSNFTLRLKN